MAFIIAHRGASGDVPENTLEAFDRAWRDGADGIELDVRLSADGRAVLSHDPTLERVCGDPRHINTISSGELNTIDVGSWKNARWKSCRIPLLSQVMKRVPEGKRIYIELKEGTETLPEVSAVVESFPHLKASITFIGFHIQTLQACRRVFPDMPLLWLIDSRALPDRWSERLIDQMITRALRSQIDGIDINASALINLSFAQSVSRAGLQLHVWDVDEVQTYLKMTRIGARSITTNYPGRLKDASPNSPHCPAINQPCMSN